MPERRSFSHRAVFIGLLAGLLLAAGAALYIYYAYIQYDRVAAQHLPAGTRAAVRLDLEKVVLYEPVRRHLLPLVNEREARERAPGAGPSRLERLERATGIELAVDMRELVLGYGPAATDWVLVVGGRFPRGAGVLDGLERLLKEEGALSSRSSDGRALIASGGIALGQAADGALVLAAREPLLRAALPQTQVYESLGLPKEGPGGFGAEGNLLSASVPRGLRVIVPALAAFDEVERVDGEVELGTDVLLHSFLRLRTASAESVGAQLKNLAAASRLVPGVPAALGRVLGATQGAEITADSPHVVRITTRVRREEVDQAAAELAGLLRIALGWS